jgi:hypothetical protein
MSNNKETKQKQGGGNQNQPKISEEQLKADQEKYKADQEKFKTQQEEQKTKQAKFKSRQNSIQEMIRNRTCFILILSILVGVFSVALIGIGIYVFLFFKEAWNNTYNWTGLIFGSVITLSIVVLIITFCHLLKKIIALPDEE